MKILLTSLIVLTVTFNSFSQSRNIKIATERADRAAKVMETFSNTFASDSIPATLLNKAKAVAVLRIAVIDDMIAKIMKGNGVLMFRGESGWSSPTFVAFNGMRTEWGRGILWPKKSIDVVFLFMDDKSFSLLSGWIHAMKPAPEITGKTAALGPIVNGKGAESVTSTASLIYYGFEEQKLSGEEFPITLFGSGMRINHDDALNKRVYHEKFQKIQSAPGGHPDLPESLVKLQKSMNEHFGGGE